MRVAWPRVRSSARLLAGLVATRLTGRPLLLSHLVTCRCPCRCETCLWRGLVEEELSADEIARIYRQASDAGVVINSIWGGEPMVREDLPEILRASHQAGMITTLITNGFRFNDRADELLPWLDTVIFSLDHASSQHDEMRGLPGLFQAVTEAVDRLNKPSVPIRVYINSVISRLNADAIGDLARWARDKRVPIYFHPIEIGMLGKPEAQAAKQPLAVDDDTLSDLVRKLLSLKARGYPIANSRTYLKGFLGGKQPYRCHARKMCLELRPNGDWIDCLDRFHPVANAREVPLGELLARPDIRRRRHRNVDCQVCNNANVIDTSNIWELHPESIVSLVRTYLRST